MCYNQRHVYTADKYEQIICKLSRSLTGREEPRAVRLTESARDAASPAQAHCET